jgi:hypothetical protein
LGEKAEEQFDPLLAGVAARHRGPLNRQQLKGRPANAPRLREFPEVKGICDLCHGKGCRPCAGTGQLYQACHLLRMHQVPADKWNDKKIRAAFLHQMWEREGHAGYPDDFYSFKDTYAEDAYRCFNRHRRPEGYCIDWHTDGVKLTDAQWKERYAESQKKLKAMGMVAPLSMEREDVFLCEFCPVSTFVTFKKREAKGMYDK